MSISKQHYSTICGCDPIHLAIICLCHTHIIRIIILVFLMSEVFARAAASNVTTDNDLSQLSCETKRDVSNKHGPQGNRLLFL